MPLVVKRNEAIIRLIVIVLGAVVLLGTIGYGYASDRRLEVEAARSEEKLHHLEVTVEKIALSNLPDRVARMEERQVRSAEDISEIKTLLKGIFGALGALLLGKLMDVMKRFS